MIRFDASYTTLPETFFSHQAPTPVARPQMLALNLPLAQALGLDAEWLAGPEGLAMLAGNQVVEGSTPIAQAYAGHQFGGWVPRLGDGRAVLLGELTGAFDPSLPRRVDVVLKGSGPTPYSRRGDGRAWLGPVLREYLVSEAMGALGVPTTRALAAVATGERVQRERGLPGAVLTRVAASHLRVGTFQYATAQAMTDAGPSAQGLRDLQALTDYAIARHYPQAEGALGLLEAVVEAQAHLIADWMALGFIHGVMNTDNMAISGETIDYGPCAFMDGYAPDKVFSSIDRMGRYAYGKQPQIGAWNLAQFASCLLPLMEGPQEAAIDALTEAVNSFVPAYQAAYLAAFGAKLGLHDAREADQPLIAAFLDLMAAGRSDFTATFRALAMGDARDHIADRPAFDAWRAKWIARAGTPDQALMQASSPALIPRNHQIEAAIQAAVQGDDAPFHRLHGALSAPYDLSPENADLARPPVAGEEVTQTFCGT